MARKNILEKLGIEPSNEELDFIKNSDGDQIGLELERIPEISMLNVADEDPCALSEAFQRCKEMGLY